jgi:hypothetical protein
MPVPEAVRPSRQRVATIKRPATQCWRRAALLAGAVGITAVVLAACSGPTDGSSASGEGAVGGTGSAGSPGAGAHVVQQPYKTVGLVGTEPGRLVLKPASGSTSVSPTWSTTSACPAGYQTSAQLYATVSGSAGQFQWISGTLNPGNTPIPAGQQLEFSSTVAQVQQVTKTPNGQTDKWVVKCTTLASGLGDRQYVQYVVVHISADGKSYTTSS